MYVFLAGEPMRAFVYIASSVTLGLLTAAGFYLARAFD